MENDMWNGSTPLRLDACRAESVSKYSESLFV